MKTVNLTKVDLLSQISENTNLIIEENSELKRLNANDIIDEAINSLARIVAVDDGEGNIELKPFITNEGLISTILEGEY